MFIPFSHAATALSLMVSSQLALPSISRIWASEREGSRCTAAWHDHRAGRPVAAKRKAGSGRQASASIQIVTFGP
jgi:hypothetical protein